jgi:hypothetical protein
MVESKRLRSGDQELLCDISHHTHSYKAGTQTLQYGRTWSGMLIVVRRDTHSGGRRR